MLKKTEVTLNYSRTVQLRQYEPMTVGVSVKLVDDMGIHDSEIATEQTNLSNFVDSVVSELITKQ